MNLLRFASAAIIAVVGALVAFLALLVVLQFRAITPEAETPLLLQLFAANIWVEFAATLISAIAVFLLIVSVMMQGRELREQRAEMKNQHEELRKQAEALVDQTRILIRQTDATEMTLRLAVEESNWEKVKDLMGDLRGLIHLRQDARVPQVQLKTFEFRGRKWKLAYSPNEDDNPDQWSVAHFLGRAALNMMRPCGQLLEALDQAEPITCPRFRNDFDLMSDLVQAIDALGAHLPEHRKTALQEMRLDLWKQNMAVILRAFDAQGIRRQGEPGADPA